MLGRLAVIFLDRTDQRTHSVAVAPQIDPGQLPLDTFGIHTLHQRSRFARVNALSYQACQQVLFQIAAHR